MADHQCTSGEVLDRFLQGSHDVDVQVIGGFIEQEDVGLRTQHAREMHPVALSAGEVIADLLLVGSGESEAGDVST